jgi:hypothetical protein
MDRLRIAISKIDSSLSDEILNQWLLENNEKRLLALLTIRKKLESASIDNPHYFETAKRFLNDPDNDCKWQSFIIIGNFMQPRPNECWQLIVEFGNSDDEDTRTAVATILLEHYFEENPHLFKTKFKELEQRVKLKGHNLFKTLTYCRSKWGSEDNNLTVENFIKKYSKGLK